MPQEIQNMSFVLAVFFTVTPIKTPDDLQNAMDEIANHALHPQAGASLDGMGFIRPLSLHEEGQQLHLQTIPLHQDKRTLRSD